MTNTQIGNSDRGITLRLLRLLNRETSGSQVRILATSTIAGLSRGALLTILNAAALAGMTGHLDPMLAAYFAAALMVHLVANFDANYATERVTNDMGQRLRMRICQQLLDAQLRFVELQGPGNIFAKLSSDLWTLSSATRDFLGGIQAAVTLIFALIYLGWLSPLGLLAALLTIAVSAATYYWQDRKAHDRLQQARKVENVFFACVHGVLHGFKELKQDRAQRTDLQDNLNAVAKEFRDLTLQVNRAYQVSAITSEAFTFALIGVVVFVLPAVSSASAVSTFQFLATIFYVVGPAQQLVSAIPAISRSKVALKSIEELEKSLNNELSKLESQERSVEPLSFRRIAMRDVHFQFVGASSAESFDLGPINLEVRAGECLFICGGNGTGKTTLLKLLTGLYQPHSGAIYVDGKKLEAQDYQAYRQLFGTVFSDFYLFAKLYGIAEPNPEDIKRILVEMQLAKKTHFEDGAFSSVELSAGQRKRLAYAISRLRDRKIYVFDEFAADQDPSFRHYFYTELLPELQRQGKTIVAVTHDDRWFGSGDRLIKLEYGRIAQNDESDSQPEMKADIAPLIAG